MQRRPAFGRGARIDARAHRRDRRRQRGQAFLQRLEVEHRAADDERHRAARADGRDRARSRRHGSAPPNRRRSGSMMSIRWCGTRARAARVGLRGADVHAAIDLRRIDADDFDGKALRERHRERALARRGRTHQQHRGNAHGYLHASHADALGALRLMLPPAHEQPIEVGERQLVPRRAAVVALARALGRPPSRAAARSSPAP